MSALTVLTVGVSLVFGLQAMDAPGDSQAGRAADWAARYDDASAALQKNDYAGAVQLFGQCVASSRTGAERVTALASYGVVLSRVNRNTEAKAALEQALAEWADEPGIDRAVTSGLLAVVDRNVGDYRGAERVLHAALAEGSVNAGYRSTLLVNLADLLREEARGNEARKILDEASQLPGLSRGERVNVMIETAQLDLDVHLWDASLALWNQIGQIAGRDGESRLDAVVDGGLGEAWLAEGNLARAEPLLRKSVQLFRQDTRSSPLQLATALAALSRLYIDENKLALAEEALSQAIAEDEESLDPGHPQIGALLELRATILSRRGEAEDARADLERGRVIMSDHFGPDSIAVAVVYAELGDVERRANRTDAAVTQYANALRIFREAGAQSTGTGAAIVARYAAALKAAHRPQEARALLATIDARAFREK